MAWGAMQLRHLDTVTQPASEGDGVKMSKIMAVAWSPNNRKLAVCTVRGEKSFECTCCVSWIDFSGW